MLRFALSRPRARLIFLFVTLTIIAAPAFFGVQTWRVKASGGQAAQTGPHVTEFTGAGNFTITRANGQAACSKATPEAAVQMRRRDLTQPMHVISRNRAGQIRTDAVTAEATGSLQIILRGTPQLENFPAAKAAFLQAAANWEALIDAPISIVVDVDFGPTWFGESYDDDVLGETDSQVLGDASIYGDVRAALVANMTTSLQSSTYDLLPQASVPTNLGSTTYILAPSATWRALGLINPVANPDGEKQDLGSPPAIGFNSKWDFDFDPSDSIGVNQLDFNAVATHELGHALGFISNVGDRELNRTDPVAVAVWDLFRFRPGITLDSFASAARILSSGGSQNFFFAGSSLALSTGRPDGTGGDKEQASHWKADELSGTHIGIMDPTLGDGERETINDNDLMALNALGYRVKADLASAAGPTITNAVYNGAKLKIKGKGFAGTLQVEINGMVVAPPLGFSNSNKKLQIKADASTLNLHSGSNQIRVLNDGLPSDIFVLSL
jgi:hypothetical protein